MVGVRLLGTRTATGSQGVNATFTLRLNMMRLAVATCAETQRGRNRAIA